MLELLAWPQDRIFYDLLPFTNQPGQWEITLERGIDGNVIYKIYCLQLHRAFALSPLRMEGYHRF